MSLTTYGRNLHANVLAGRDTIPASWWLMLMLSAPDPAESMATTAAREPSGASYGRQEVQTGSGHWSDAAGGTSAFTDVLTWTPAEDWGRIICWGLATAETSGTLYRFGTLASPVNARTGITLSNSGYPRIEVPA